MNNALQIAVAAVAVGGLYALVGISFSITYASARVINFSTGEMFMLAAFVALSLFKLGVPLYVMLPLAILFTGLFTVVLERLVIRRVYGFDDLTLLIVTIGLSISLRTGAQMIWGTVPDAFPQLFPGDTIHMGGVVITPTNLGILVVAALLIVLLHLFLFHSPIGAAMRAVAQNREVASLMGINVPLFLTFTWGLSAAVAGASGILMAPVYFVTTDMGVAIALKGFAAATIGGLGNVPGAILGGILVGLAEGFGAATISSTYKDAIAFGLMILVMFFKPHGLLGRAIEKY